MARPPHRFLLELSRDRWSLWGVDDLDGGRLRADAWRLEEPEPVAVALAEHFEANGVAAPELVLGLEGGLCLAARFSVASTRQTRRRAALLYKLEESLPVSAEDLAAEFVRNGAEVFGVCCQLSWLEALVRSLTEAGAVVRCVSPLAMLALDDHLRRHKVEKDHTVIWAGPGGSEWMEVVSGRPAAWRRLPAGAADLDREIDAAELSLNPLKKIYLLGDAAAFPERAVPLQAVGEEAASLLDAARRQAAVVLSGDAGACVNLLRGDLAELVCRHDPLRRDALAVKVAALALLVAVGFYLASSAWHARAELARLDDAQSGVYRSVFPDKRVPVGVRSRLASELRRLRGVRGEAGATPQELHALRVVKTVLESLPAEMRYRVLEVRLENNRLQIAGQVRSHSDADLIAAGLRRQGIPVGSPTTQQLPDKGVEFRLSADLHQQAGPAA